MGVPVPPIELPFSRRVRSAVGLLSLQFNVGRRWSRVEPNPRRPDPVLPVRLFGIVTAWFEGDVIEATVHNAFAQGCERVFIVDNQSPDSTVARAVAAGAEIGSVYYTDFNDVDRRQAEVRSVIDTVVAEVGADHAWWLICDADEFVHGPGGLRIVDYLAGLDRRFRVVGTRVFEHFPTTEPANVPGRHPLDYQPWCQELPMAWCRVRHWKHPLIRWDRSGPEVRPDDKGMHRVRGPVRVHEPSEGAFMHHFQYRNRPDTSERLRHLCEAQEDGTVRSALADVVQKQTSHARRRWATLDHIYSQDWAHVVRRTPRGYTQGVEPKPWTSLVSPADAQVARWYALALDH